MFSGVACRDASCAMFKTLEKKKLGTRIVSKINGKIEQRVVIACVDDADICTSSEKIEKKIQEIASHCVKMHEAAGGEVQK